MPARLFDQVAWPISRLGAAITAQAQASDLARPPLKAVPTPVELAQADEAGVNRWLAATAHQLGIEAEPVDASYAELSQFLRKAGPALLALPGAGPPRFLALLRGDRRYVSVLGPELERRRLPVTAVCAALRHPLEAPLLADVNRALDAAGVPSRRRDRARQAMVRQRLGPARAGFGWLLRLPAGSPFWQQVHAAGLNRYLWLFGGAHAAQYTMWIGAWWIIGHSVLQGRFDAGWFLAWVLLLLTLIPFRLLVTYAQGRLAIGVGALLKQRFLAGALRLRPGEVRRQGAGQFMSQVMESEAVESLALNGGFAGFLALIELAVAAAVLGAGSAGGAHVSLLLLWLGLALALGWWQLRRQRAWTKARLAMTHDLVESMVGHRTRLVQEMPAQRHEVEDAALASYLPLVRRMDRSTTLLAALLPRGWLALGLLGLVPAFIDGRFDTSSLAISLGGVLLATQALHKLETGLRHLVGAAVAWESVAWLFNAAARPASAGAPALALAKKPPAVNNKPLLAGRQLYFQYGNHREPILQGCDLHIRQGERLLLEGASGSGKSTLVSLLTGLRTPASGKLLLHGWSRTDAGDEWWREQITATPQFHENHVLTETFAFNLLMGRRWPPLPEDLVAAEAVCRDLGLGDLLDRMPAGLSQMVGETGWQLSHGERSRLYVARSLLQTADLIILDESFAALDPENLERALRYVLKQADTVLVVAHP